MIARYLSLSFVLCGCVFFTNAQQWKNYPYHETGSVLTFPRDEGYHPGEIVEWWYTNAHLKGDSTGTDYAMMFTYFYYPQFGFDGFRIFELSNENTGAFLTNSTPCRYPTMDTTQLNIAATTGLTGNGHEEWKTIDSSGVLKPFEYHLTGNMTNGSFDLTYKAVKRPLMVGGTGFLYEGETGYTYYYSQTGLEATGTLTMNGVTEPVHGIAWIDRQWGQFNPSNGEQYTWFSLQLSNGMDLNLWNIFNTESQIPDTSTYRFCTAYLSDSTNATFSNFTLERLKYTYTPDSASCYDQKWRLTYGNTDLIITATHINNIVELPFRFFEGNVLIEGTVDGQAVNGLGYVELLHSFKNPEVAFTSPIPNAGWNGNTAISWQLLNPDDGRPVWYDLSVSTDNQQTFTTIASHLSDTSYLWAPSLPQGTAGWLRVKAYSIDTTLVNTVTAAGPFYFGVAGIANSFMKDDIQLMPNPFTNSTNIEFVLQQSADVSMDIVNIKGEVIKRFNSQKFTAGRNRLVWNAENFAAGVYYYRLKIDDKSVTGKLIKQ